MSETVIYTAPYVLTSEHNIIRDGAIAVQSDRIVDVGSRKSIIQSWNSTRLIDRQGIFLPPLINCHTHLELSHLVEIPAPEPNSGMTGWIENVLESRQQNQSSPQELVENYTTAVHKQHQSGVVLLADIINAFEAGLPQGYNCTEVCQIVEVIAPTLQRTSETLQCIEKLPTTLAVSPHAPYSSSAHLIRSLKQRAQLNHQVFSIHLGESAAELELLEFQSGEFRQFLEKRKSWDDTLLGKVTAKGSVYYLDKLGVLDDRTLCVHCVHISDEEIAILSKRKAKVCVCPGSNSFLGVGKVPLEKILQAGILPGIGTDSRASNEDVDMWREMQILRKQFPSVSAEKILAMATQGGAMSLHRQKDFGTLEKGKKALFLEVVLDNFEKLTDRDVFESLTADGRPESLNWVSPGMER